MRIRIKLNVITERERGREREKKRYKTSGSAKVPSRGYGNETFDGTRTKHPTEGEICTQPPKKHTKTYTHAKYNRNTDKTHTQRETYRRESPHIRIYPKSETHSFRWEKIQNFLTFTPLLRIKDVYDDQRQKNRLDDHHQTQKHDSCLSFSHKTGPLSHVFGVCFTGFHAIENRENLRFRARTRTSSSSEDAATCASASSSPRRTS